MFFEVAKLARAHYLLIREATTMSDTIDATKQEWVARVLGVRPGSTAKPEPAVDFKSKWKASFESWRDAIETVDSQMAALGAACRQTKDPWLEAIADMGLPALTKNHKTPLMAACMEVSQATGEKVPVAAAKARTAIENFAKHIGSDPKIAGCERNPFGVSVSIRATLGPALKSLNDALRAAR